MPSEHPFLVALRGTPEYARYLDRLHKAVRASGVQLGDGPNALAEYALTVLGLRYNLISPARMPKPGRPRKVKDAG
jgi:hypothetical protein